MAIKVRRGLDRRNVGLILAIVLAAVFNLYSESRIISASLPSGSSATAAEGKDARNATKQPPLTILSNPSTTRWNSTEFKDALMENSTLNNFSLAELVHRVPKPQGTDVEVYNADAWHRLRVMLGLEFSTISSTEESYVDRVVLCSDGGSSTAGGGHVKPDERWDQTFANMLRATTIPNNNDNNNDDDDVERYYPVVVNRAHGSRGSVHSAFVFHSLILPDADIIVWEFAINDGHPLGCEEINNGIIVFLDQVARHSSPPPLVILAYFWDPNFPWSNGRVQDTVFQCHNHLPAQYDFVVGSVNLASYLTNLGWERTTVMNFFLADHHHPSARGHWFLAFLLWDLVTDEQRHPRTLLLPPAVPGNLTESLNNNNNKTKIKPHWACAQSPNAKRLVNHLLTDGYSFASWTGEAPRNEVHNRGMIYPQIYHNDSDTMDGSMNITTVLTGKATEERQDRKIAVILPCCTSGYRFRFDLTEDRTYFASKSISALQLYFPDLKSVESLCSSVSVQLLDSERNAVWTSPTCNTSASADASSTNQTTIASPEWVVYGSRECRVGHWFLNTWLALPNATRVSRIDVCSTKTDCGKGNHDISLMHVALF